MKTIRHRNAWIWVAVAAMSIAFVARAQSGMQNARAYTNPVLEFLSGHPAEQSLAVSGVDRYLQTRSARAPRHGTDTGTRIAMLTVQFVGLVSPLNVLSPKAVLCIGRAPATPLHPFSFQRPPPSSLL